MRMVVGILLLIVMSVPSWARYFEDEYDGGPYAQRLDAVVFADDFEAGAWRAHKYSGDRSGSGPKGVLWMHSQMQGAHSGLVVAAPAPIRRGKHAMRFEWRPEAYQKSNTSKKAMLHGPKVRQSKDVERWYAFSVYLPKDGMAQDSNPMLFFQLHATPDHNLKEPWRQPIASIGINSSGIIAYGWSYDTDQVSPKNKNIVKNRTSVPIGHISSWWNRWTDVVWRVRYDPFGKGLLQIWINGKQIADHQNIAIGYNDKAGAYPSYGLYYHTGKGDRRHWIYFDEISIGNEQATSSSFGSVR
mgnify:FL=1